MVAKRLIRSASIWTLVTTVCLGSVSLRTAIAQVQTSEAKTPAAEEWVALRLVDEDGQPVAGAKVGRDVGLDNPRIAGEQLDWSKAATSDENGQVVMRRVDIFSWGTDQTAPYILHEARGIGATPEIPHQHSGERPPIVLTPMCRVHGTLSAEAVPASDIPLQWMDIVVHTTNTHNWMLHGSFPVGEKRNFDLLLPPGQYSLRAYGMENQTRRGPTISERVRYERRTFTVTPDRPDLKLDVISLRPTKVWSLIGQPAPEIGPLKAWKNGSPVTLADLRGQLVWLHFGHANPQPAMSLPWLTELHHAFSDKGLTIIAIYNCDSVEELDRRWAEAYERDRWVEAHGKSAGVREVPFRIAIDGGEPTLYDGTDELRSGATYARYDITGYPTSVLIDQTGNIIEMPDSANIKDAIAERLGVQVVKPQPIVWQPQFYGLYRLEDEQVLKRIVPPFIPERAEYFKGKLKNLDSPAPLDFMLPSRTIFGWNGELKEMGWTHGKGATHLESILDQVFRLGETEYEGPLDLLRLDLPGDWIVRADASLEARFLALEKIIAAELGRKIQFEKRPLERSVIVARGRFRLRSPARTPEDSTVHLYATGGQPDPGGSRWPAKSTDNLLSMLGHRTKMPIVNRTEHEESTDIVFFHEHPSIWLRELKDAQKKQLRLQQFFDHLAAQTQLRLEIRREPLPTWCITEQSRP